MKFKIKLTYLVILATCAAFQAYCQQVPELIPKDSMKDFKKKAPVIVNGDKVEYIQDKNIIVASGNIRVNYDDVVLTCEKITVHTDTKLGICEGQVKIVQGSKMFTGEHIEYNFEQKTGRILKGEVSAAPFFGYAGDIEKESDELVELRDGYATTCDHDKPHYRIVAKEIQFYLNDKIVARHVYLYLGDVPVMYVPYYVQPIMDYKTKITVMPGYMDEWGYYALGSYRYYMSEEMKGYVRLDYRHKKGLGTGVDNNINLKKLGEGLFRYYYTQENNALTMAPTGDVRDRYRMQYKHSLDLTPDTKAMLEINKTSDRDFVKDYFFRELDDGWSPDNYLSVVNSKENYNMQLLVRKQLDKFVTVTERLPEAKLEVYDQRLWETNFYYYNELSFSNLRNVYDEATILDDEESVRANTYNKLSYVTKTFGFLYTTPYIATRQTYYSKNMWGDENNFRQIYEYGLNLSTKFYKMWDVKTAFCDINNLRHVVTPSVNFFHRHQPTIASENLIRFDEIDGYNKANSINLSLENKLQTKRRSGESLQSVDLLRFIISTDYYFRLKKQSLVSKGDGEFGPVYYDLELKPLDYIFIKSTITQNIKKNRLSNCIEAANTDLIYDAGDKFSFGLGHRYESTENYKASQFTSELNYKFDKDWGTRIYQRFDPAQKKWEEQEYTIYKDFHCWVGEFTVSVKEETFGFWMIFRLKAFPEVPLGLRNTYRRPSPGTSL